MSWFPKRHAAAATIVAVGMAVSIQGAHAQYLTNAEAAIDTNRIITAGETDTTSVTTAIGAQTTSLVTALEGHSSQQTANMQAQTQSMANMNTVMDQRAVTMHVEDAKLRAATAATSGASVCNVVTGAIRTQNLDLLVRNWRTQAVQAQLQWENGYLNASSTPLNRDQDLTAFISNHCGTTPSAEDVRAGVCSSTTGSATPETSTTLATAPEDESADNILNLTTLTPDEAKSAQRFMLMTMNPNPSGSIAPGSGMTPPGKIHAFAMMAQHARKSIPGSIMAGLVGQETVIGSNTTSETAAQAWAEATAKAAGIAVPQDAASSTYYPNGISDLGMMELRSRAWYFNPDFGVQLSGQNVDATAKDMAMMQSWQVYMQWRQYQLMREIDSSLALISAILVEKNPVADSQG